MESVRIAMFSDSALPILNGVSISVDALVNELRDQGHSVHLFVPGAPGFRDSDPNTHRFRSMPTPWATQYPVAYPPFLRNLRQFRRNEYDLIHTHTPFVLGLVGLRWAESHDLPIVSTYHTLYDRYAHYWTFAPRRYVRFRIAKHTNFYYNRVDHVITPSDASHKWLRRHSVATDVTIIPTGVRGRGLFTRAETRQELGISPDHKVMLYVGRLAQEKNLTVVFDMAARVMKDHPKARLLLVGDGPFRDECTALARSHSIGDKVRFAGFVPRGEVDKYYAAADLFVFSSITETQGLVVQEAMSYALPSVVVAGGGAGAGIVNGRNGFVVKNNPAAFARQVIRILEDDELHAQLGDEAAKSVRCSGISEMADSVLGVYRKVLSQRQPSEGVDRFAWI